MTSRTPLNTAIRPVLFGAGLLLSASAIAAPEGLYSANELLDADVYAKSDNAEAIGEVEDVLLDNDMRVHSLVIDAGDLLDLGDKQYVVDAEHFTVETRNGDSLDNIEYSVHLDLDAQALGEQPEYTDTWWNQAKDNLQQAWSDTKEGAASAWETTRSATSDALDKAGNVLESVGEETQQAADDAAQ
ncbi:PRC-barrel domain-containing protein [Halomonas caseinilytica]|uniref:PRC-barrel domain-containing protein n=1 Tax=Halomonas caseinilytica TaxID=438744 RepID=UPI000848B440|nr:PRC-barrel domain-containing protein [Halomonas caseinilytica]